MTKSYLQSLSNKNTEFRKRTLKITILQATQFSGYLLYVINVLQLIRDPACKFVICNIPASISKKTLHEVL